jgi:hypothetical protein
MVIVDGAYAKKPFLSRMLKAGAVVVSRLRKDAALFDIPEPVKRRGSRKSRPDCGLNRPHDRLRIRQSQDAMTYMGWWRELTAVIGDRAD